MPLYRRRLPQISAIQYTDDIANSGWPSELVAEHPWINSAFDMGVLVSIDTPDVQRLVLDKYDSAVEIVPGHWIVRESGQISVYPNNIFNTLFEAEVDEDMVTRHSITGAAPQNPTSKVWYSRIESK